MEMPDVGLSQSASSSLNSYRERCAFLFYHFVSERFAYSDWYIVL